MEIQPQEKAGPGSGADPGVPGAAKPCCSSSPCPAQRCRIAAVPFDGKGVFMGTLIFLKKRFCPSCAQHLPGCCHPSTKRARVEPAGRLASTYRCPSPSLTHGQHCSLLSKGGGTHRWLLLALWAPLLVRLCASEALCKPICFRPNCKSLAGDFGQAPTSPKAGFPSRIYELGGQARLPLELHQPLFSSSAGSPCNDRRHTLTSTSSCITKHQACWAGDERCTGKEH